jgi:hypothetical protein
MGFNFEQSKKAVVRYMAVGLCASVILSSVVALAGMNAARPQSPAANRKRGAFRKVEPNLNAPELYADKLKPVFCLVNLPGAGSPGSYMEASYQVYFVAEAAFNEGLKKILDAGGQLTSPTQLTDKIQLGEGRFRLTRLATVDERTHTAKLIDFKAKVPDNLRTKFATVIISFSVKIYDGKLKTPFYRSSFFMTQPFGDDPAQPGRAVPRNTLYTNFFITQKGDLFTSQWPRAPGDVTWHP